MLRFQITGDICEPPDGVNLSCTVTSFALVPNDVLVIPTVLMFVFVIVEELFSNCSFEVPFVTVHVNVPFPALFAVSVAVIPPGKPSGGVLPSPKNQRGLSWEIVGGTSHCALQSTGYGWEIHT